MLALHISLSDRLTIGELLAGSKLDANMFLIVSCSWLLNTVRSLFSTNSAVIGWFSASFLVCLSGTLFSRLTSFSLNLLFHNSSAFMCTLLLLGDVKDGRSFPGFYWVRSLQLIGLEVIDLPSALIDSDEFQLPYFLFKLMSMPCGLTWPQITCHIQSFWNSQSTNIGRTSAKYFSSKEVKKLDAECVALHSCSVCCCNTAPSRLCLRHGHFSDVGSFWSILFRWSSGSPS